MDWPLYDRDLLHERVKGKERKNLVSKISQNSQEKVSVADTHILTDILGLFLKRKCNRHVILFMMR